jgi:transposase-like protein
MYSVVYVDCIYCYVKRDLFGEKMAVYVVIGIDLDGFKEVLGLYIDKTESATFWKGIFEDIKQRGTEDILFVCMDGLKGLAEVITKVFPKVITQKCVVHIVRNIYDSIPKKDAKNIIADFKKIYTSPNLELARGEYKNFIEKYADNKNLVNRVTSVIEDIYGLFDFPAEIRKLIYTTNAIESVNSGLRKVTRGRGSFIHESALLKVLYLRIKDLEKKWAKGTAGWKTIQNQLIELFGDRILKYIEQGAEK